MPTGRKPVPDPEDTKETYDLVVAGAGSAGLSAAYFYRQRAGASARILVLDNHTISAATQAHEYTYEGRKFLAAGGSDYFVSPSWRMNAKP